MKMLDNERDRRLILVVGQAAQGKSTLAASWIHRSDGPTAWINLGAEDSDPVNLFHLLVQSLQKSCTGTDLSHLSEYPGIVVGPRAQIPRYLDWVSALFGAIEGSVRIVFDGLDRLLPDAASFRFFHVLVAEASENIRLVMLSRSMPPFDVERLRMERRAAIIENHELAFSLEETSAFFKEICGITLGPELVQKVHGLTEGWVGGLILLSESIRCMPEEEAMQYLLGGFAPHLKAEVFRYLGQEIFTWQPKDVQTLLIHSSIVEVVEPGFARDLLGMEKSEEILQDLSRRNLFIQPIYDEKKGWLFRYHQLFREFLRAKFEAETNQEERRYWFSRAGSLLENAHDLDGAIRCFLEAKSYPEVVRLIEKTGLDLLRARKTWDLSRWLQDLPEDFLAERPWLLFFHYMTGRFTGSLDGLANLLKALTLFEQQGDPGGSMLSLAYLIEVATAWQHSSIPPINSLLARGEGLLESPPLERFPYARAVLWLQMGFAHCLRSGNPHKGYFACQRAYLLAKGIRAIPLQLLALVHMYFSLSILGDFPRAEKIINKTERLLAKTSFPELRTYHLINLSICYWLEGETAKGQERLQTAGEEIERHGLTSFFLVKMLNDLILKSTAGQYTEAEATGECLLELTIASGYSFLHGGSLLFLGLCFYKKGDIPKAAELLLRARGVFSSDETSAPLHLSWIKVLLSLIARHMPPTWDFEKGLQEAFDHFEAISSPFHLREAHLAAALREWKHGENEKAAAHLQAGMKMAQEMGYRHWLMLNQEDLLRACILVLELDVEGVRQYATDLLRGPLAAVAKPELKKLSLRASAKIAERARQIDRTIHRSTRLRLRIETLGGFRVLRGDAPIDSKGWCGNQPRRFLMALVCRGCRKVPLELLVDDLWPEAPPDAGRRNFQINLHRLRKAIEPDQSERFGSSYIHLKHNTLSLDVELCKLDVDDFLRKMEGGARKEAQGDPKGALRVYIQAVELYRGDFLPQELYSPWATARREELHRKYLDLLSKIAQLYEKQGAFRKAIRYKQMLIRADPGNEGAYRNIMVLYANLGMRTEALRTYEECRKAMHRHLDAEPDDLTTALFNKLHEGLQPWEST